MASTGYLQLCNFFLFSDLGETPGSGSDRTVYTLYTCIYITSH